MKMENRGINLPPLRPLLPQWNMPSKHDTWEWALQLDKMPYPDADSWVQVDMNARHFYHLVQDRVHMAWYIDVLEAKLRAFRAVTKNKEESLMGVGRDRPFRPIQPK